MPSTVEITIVSQGVAVTIGERRERFSCLDDALEYAQRRLERVRDLQELSARCE